MPLRLIGMAAGMAIAAAIAPASAAEVTVEMHRVSAEGIGDPIGTVVFRDSAEGGSVVIATMTGLQPGPHGLHLHENGSCEPGEDDQGEMAAAMAAGGHWDPEQTGEHRGPNGRGHRGDLPVLQVLVDEDGAKDVKRVGYAPHVSPDEVSGLAVVIHEHGDNYQDEPKPSGGGGPRIACGVVP